MSTLLAPNPIRTSPDMTTGHETAAMMAEGDDRPLGYLYATWEPSLPGRPRTAPAELGRYNPQTQTWDAPPGVITAGHWTLSTPDPWVQPEKVDDACA